MKQHGWLVFAAFALQGPAPDDKNVTAALADYRAGRYEAAFTSFRQELEARGDGAPAELRLDGALAALRLSRTRDAEALLQPLLDSPSPHHLADVLFLQGQIAWQRAERAIAAARLADAEPMAWTMATTSLQRAHGHFVEAARARQDWPAACRNAERALHRQREVERERDATAAPDAKQENAPDPPPPQPGTDPEEVAPTLQAAPLSAAELRRLQERVLQQQRDKLRQRADQQHAATTAGERDW
jgi:hypothetical protein